MSVTLNINGVNYFYPEIGDTDWGQNATLWAQAVTSGMLQKAGGTFTLTANVDFGASYGLVSSHFTARTSNSASAGTLRLARTDYVGWRNNANDGNLALTVNASDQLTFDGDVVFTLADATISNANIAANAAIALSKLEAVTASRALVSNGSGAVSASSVTSTEIGYVSGVTSAIQTQINAKVNLSGSTMTGSLILNGLPTVANEAANKQYVDNAALGISPKSPCACATTANITLSGEQTIDGVLTSASRVLVKNQTLSQNNGIYVSAAGAWTRSTDADTWAELVQAYTLISAGTVNGGASWLSNIAAGGTLGTTPVTFLQFGSTTIYSADGQGIELTGTQFSLELDGTTLSKSASGLKVNQIADAQIASGASIARNKIATGPAYRVLVNDASGILTNTNAITAARALISDSDGLPAHSSITATELFYLSGVTSSIQTQINTKTSNPMNALGDIIYGGVAGTPTRLPNGNPAQFLRATGSSVAWSTPFSGVVSKTAAYTAALADDVILVDTSGGSFNITLPTAVGIAGKIYTIKKTDTSLTAAGIDTTSSQTIDGFTSITINTQNESVQVVSNGVNWSMISRQGNYSAPTAYTPTFTNFGAVVTSNVKSWREGRYLCIYGSWTAPTTGGTVGSVSIGFGGSNTPAGLIIDSTLIPSSPNRIVGTYGSTNTASALGTVLTQVGTSTTLMYFGTQNAAICNSNAMGGAGTIIVINARIPISSWN